MALIAPLDSQLPFGPFGLRFNLASAARCWERRLLGNATLRRVISIKMFQTSQRIQAHIPFSRRRVLNVSPPGHNSQLDWEALDRVAVILQYCRCLRGAPVSRRAESCWDGKLEEAAALAGNTHSLQCIFMRFSLCCCCCFEICF